LDYKPEERNCHKKAQKAQKADPFVHLVHFGGYPVVFHPAGLSVIVAFFKILLTGQELNILVTV
jgi:hypothetical protein